MADGGSVTVRLIADLRSLQTGLTRAAGLVKGFANTTMLPLRTLDNTFKKLFSIRNLAIAGVITQIVRVGAAAEEAENLFEVSFGKMSDSVRAWSKEFAEFYKVSEYGARKTAGSFQLFLANMDMGADLARKMSLQLTDLAYNISSLRNMPFDVTMEKIMSGLAGMPRPLQDIGINVKKAAQEAWALKHGLDAQTESWTQAQTAIAMTGVLMEQTTMDAGDLKRTMDSTTNILRSIKDAFEEVAIIVYTEWQVYIQTAFKDLRDWLIENREVIGKWAGVVGAHFIYVKDIFVGFVRTLQQSPKEGFTVLMKSLIEVMKAAASIAIDLAVRIGKGIWEGVREGVFGGKDLEAEAMKRYKAPTSTRKVSPETWRALGGNKEPPEVPIGGGLTKKVRVPMAAAPGYTYKEVAVDQERYAKELAAVQAEEAQRITKPILAGFGDNVLSTFEQAGKKIVVGAEIFTGYVDEAGSELAKSVAAIEARYPEKSEAELAMEGWGRTMFGGELYKDTMDRLRQELDLANEHRKQASLKNIQQEEFNRHIQALIKDLELETESIGMSNAERQKAKILQDATNDALKAQVTFTDEHRMEIIQVINEQQRALGATGTFLSGVSAGVKKMQGELKSLSEIGMEVAESFRDGMADALADALVGVRDLQSALRAVAMDMARMLARRGMEQIITGAMGAIGGAFAGGAAGAPHTSYPEGIEVMSPAYPARGGMVRGPVYAASGFWKPRGSDTVPAMLTPGEVVLDQNASKRLQDLLGIGADSRFELHIHDQSGPGIDILDGGIENRVDRRVGNLVVRDRLRRGHKMGSY